MHSLFKSMKLKNFLLISLFILGLCSLCLYLAYSHLSEVRAKELSYSDHIAAKYISSQIDSLSISTGGGCRASYFSTPVVEGKWIIYVPKNCDVDIPFRLNQLQDRLIKSMSHLGSTPDIVVSWKAIQQPDTTNEHYDYYEVNILYRGVSYK